MIDQIKSQLEKFEVKKKEIEPKIGDLNREREEEIEKGRKARRLNSKHHSPDRQAGDK